MKLSSIMVLGVALAGVIGVTSLWVASSLVEGAVTRDATRRSMEWTQYAVHRLERIETLAAGAPPTETEWKIIEDLATFGGVFRFKVFGPDGVLQFESDDPSTSGGSLGQHNPTAFQVITTGEPYSIVADGSQKENRPDLYSETYLPVIIDGKKVAIIETYLDQTTKTALIQREYTLFGGLIVALVVLALATPSAGLFTLFRRLRRQNVELDKERLRALAADLAKSEFIATVSHELRTPMNGIIGVAQLLEADELSEEQSELLEILSSCAEAQMTLIEELLTFGTIESGAIDLLEEAVPLAPFVKQATSFATIAADTKDVVFTVAVPDDDLEVMIDSKRLRQVLANLVGNAIKFTDAGKVELNVGFTPGQGTDCGELRFDVTDTGPGIPFDQHERIFERFTQVDSAIDRKAGGTGLGLAISGAIVREMKGKITLSSVPGEGSTFTVRLPVRLALCDATDDQIAKEAA